MAPSRRPGNFNDHAAAAPESSEDVSIPSQIRGGWTEATKQAESASEYAQALRLESNLQIIKFLEDAPYASYKRHWIDRNGPSGPTKRAYVCYKTVDRSCPLCNVGDKPQAVSAFNVALVGDDGQMLLKSWDVGVKLLNVIRGFNADPKIGPLTKGFFAVSKTGAGSGAMRGGTTQTNVIPVKASALLEDYGINVPDQDALDAIDTYDSSIIKLPKMSDMEEIAEELATSGLS